MTRSGPDQSRQDNPRLRVAHLSARNPNPFDLQPDQAARDELAQELGLDALPRLRLSGEIVARSGDAWELTGRLRAKVVQPCVISLRPVETVIDEPVHRVFSPHLAAPDEDESEMPDDETEPLGQFIDLADLAAGELALAIPEYPRHPDAEPPADSPDDAPETRRPFADLDKLLRKPGE